jgi:hypothetical protein
MLFWLSRAVDGFNAKTNSAFAFRQTLSAQIRSCARTGLRQDPEFSELLLAVSSSLPEMISDASILLSP